MKTYKIHFESDCAEMYETYDGCGFEYDEAKNIVDVYNAQVQEGHFDKFEES